MNKLSKLIGKKKTLVFVDLEGTQVSHEMIAIGAVRCTLNAKGRIKKFFKPFKKYVKAKNHVGKVVEKLTHITDEQLKKEGVSFFEAMEAFKKYCGISYKNAMFVTFGSHDIRIIQQSMQYTFHCPKEICEHVIKNHIDFLTIISEFIKDDQNNPYSLVNYCKLFNVPEAGEAHDPYVDAMNLAMLYNAFLDDKDIVFEEYKKLLTHINHVPYAVKEIMSILCSGGTVDQETYEKILKDYIND